MSQEDKEMASCQVVIEANTRIIAKLYRVRWTIENISQLFEFNEIKGPKLCFLDTCMCYISFVRLKYLLMVKLHNESNQSLKIIKSKLILWDCDGTKLFEMKNQYQTLKKDQNIALIFKSLNNLEGGIHTLKDDKLIIDCCLKVVGKVVTKSNSNKSEKESQNKLLRDLKMLYSNPEGSDFTLHVGNDCIYAHKTVLSFRSAYFKSMFDTQMKEKEQNSVTVTDVSYPTMKNLIEFLYTGDFTMTSKKGSVQEVSNLYIAADKYQVMDLRSLCADKLISIASVDNILGILQLAARHNDEDFQFEAKKFVCFHFDKVVNSNRWKKFISSDVGLASEILNFYSKT